ncbi:glycosyl transferase [Erythrobacter sp. KY5]|nr:glycosyl transferase [Erythrobacter sp. KY5]
MALSPWLYAKCAFWRLTGKRLRARLRLAPILGSTPHAYNLWQALRENERDTPEEMGSARLIALVEDGDGTEATLESLRQAGIEAQIIAHDADAALRALSNEQGELWVMPLASGDRVNPRAGKIYRNTADAAPQSGCLIYADDDLIDRKGQRKAPHFKPDWNSELFQYHDYLTGAAIVRAGLRVEPGDDWARALIEHGISTTRELGGEVIHCPTVLHHRRKRPEPRVPTAHPKPGSPLPSVSVLVPTRDRVDLLRTCLEGLARTDYPQSTEIIVIDNGSTDPETRDYLASLDPDFARVLRDDRDFNFSALNNRAAVEAKGELLCFLNNDIQIADPRWLKAMAAQAIRPEVGAVGAQLLYPDGRIQHAGVVTGIGGAAAHAHRLLRPKDLGYFQRHNLPQFASAVTAACMVVSRHKFDAVGGYDEDKFAVSFNDVDLCLRLRAKGWHNLYEPRAQLVHHESVSRGRDLDPVGSARQRREVEALQERWGTQLVMSEEIGERPAHDPFHHPELSPYSEQFVLRL